MAYKVLIIDDEPWSRSLVISLIHWKALELELAGEAEDTQEGLEKILELKPDIIVTDMKMPGSSGVDFLQTINKTYPHAQLIVLSGYGEFGYLQQALRSGAVDYLLKPVDPDLLNKNLQESIRRLDENLAGGFPDPRVYQEYLWYRKKILQELSELDHHSLRDSLHDLSCLLQENLSYPKDRWMYTGMKKELLGQLVAFIQEFPVEAGCIKEIQDVWLDHNELQMPDSRQLFHLLLDSYLRGIQGVEDYQNKRKFLDSAEVARYIDQHFCETLGLDSLAKLFLVTKEHLCRTFRQAYGVTILDYITKNRMEYARRVLMDRDVSIKEIPFSCGYTDLPYFYRVFKQYFGTTPGEMRKMKNDVSI